MAAEIFGTRFVSHREPAWHRLGTVLEEPVSASAALDIAGDYQVSLEPLHITVGGTSLPVDGKRAIVRGQTDDDPTHRVFGIVSDQYHLVTPREMVGIWDDATAAPIETLGALRNGETLFIATKLPTISIKGDDVEQYLLAVNPMNGRGAAVVRITPVRVVCQNTLILSAARTVEAFSIPHHASVAQVLTKWLRQAYLQSVEKSQAVKEVFEVLASARATTAAMESVALAAYPDPARARRSSTPEMVARRDAADEEAREFAVASRAAAVALFEGAGTGMDAEAAKGTLWGAYNAVTEYENYRRHRGIGSSYDIIFGNRAEAMERAFNQCVAIATNTVTVPSAFSAAFSN